MEAPGGQEIQQPWLAEFTRGAQEAGNTVVHETGDHYLYICDVEQVYGNEAEEAVFAWNGYSQVRPAK
jgi:hypothetical protein